MINQREEEIVQEELDNFGETYKKHISKKLLSPLEALENIKWCWDCDISKVEECFDIIETALKKLEKIENSTVSVLREDISKELKALEIIKKLFKGHLNIDYDKNHDFYEIWTSNEYEDVFVIASGKGKDEYELLKEVLL